MSDALKWLETESDRLEKECNENSDPHKTVNHSFLEGFNYALVNAQALEQPKLNDNQQIVLEWLKETSEKYAIKMNPIASIYTLHSNYATNDTADIFDAYEELSDVEEAQVIQAFSAWVLEKEEDAE